MRKRLTLPFLLLISAAQAAEPVDCGTIQVVNLSFIYYKTKVAFPDVSQAKTVTLADLKTPFKACQITFAGNNKGEVTIKAPDVTSLEYLTNHFRQTGSMHLTLRLLDGTGRSTEGLDITLNLSKVTQQFGASISVRAAMSSNTAVGIKVDGGKLQPLFFNGSRLNVPISSKAKTVDFYVKTPLLTNWQRVTVNLADPKITVYRKSEFPKK